MNFNDQGGLVPETQGELKRARAADLGTLPVNIPGTNCGNCKFFHNTSFNAGEIDIGHCSHPRLRQGVTSRMCCAFWDTPGFLRS